MVDGWLHPKTTTAASRNVENTLNHDTLCKVLSRLSRLCGADILINASVHLPLRIPAP